MKLSIASIVAGAALVAQGVSGHYIFHSLTAGTGKGTPYEYVRRNTNMNSPVTGKYPPRAMISTISPKTPYARGGLFC